MRVGGRSSVPCAWPSATRDRDGTRIGTVTATTPSCPHANPPVSPRILGRQDADRGSLPAPDAIAAGGSCWPSLVGAGPGHARAHETRRPQLHVIMVKNLLIQSLVWIRLGISLAAGLVAYGTSTAWIRDINCTTHSQFFSPNTYLTTRFHYPFSLPE